MKTCGMRGGLYIKELLNRRDCTGGEWGMINELGRDVE